MISVLYIDDDPELLQAGRTLLEESGFLSVETCRSDTEARERLRHTTYDAILSENCPPDIDGSRLLREVRRISPLLPVLFFARTYSGDAVIDALNGGADHYRQKGRDPTTQYGELAHQIRAAVERRMSARRTAHLARLYRIISQTNAASASLRNRKALLEEVCRIVVADGSFLSAWIGLFRYDNGCFEPEAWYCRTDDTGYPPVSAEDLLALGSALKEIVIGKGIYYASTDNRHDPLLAPWAGSLAAHGIGSSAAFPLRVGDQVIGVMIFNAQETGFFSEEEVQLLVELTDTLSLALELMEKEYLITKLIQLSDALQLANKKLNLLSNITRHDTLNQLTALGGYIELARMQTTDPDVLEYIQKEERALESIRQQISFTREYQNIGVHAPLWQNVQDIVERASRTASMGQVKIRSDLQSIEIFADPLLEKVFFNLLENARNHGMNVSRIHFSARESDSGLIITCEDNGGGIPDAEKENIFNRKFFKNTGFGLFLSREILAITGILIRETGISGTGARFEIIIPNEKFRVPFQQGIL
ncbi:response regulator [Methanoregula sp.]|uniref:response regulator n=1 Tax=Methanoregula sp. TaxID=2052170 RepID=UPI00236D7A1E|nr:response regulator [Methanoregula sp.]MDD1685360.1 GAF domain-containing protein [Methanoregula sp.]